MHNLYHKNIHPVLAQKESVSLLIRVKTFQLLNTEITADCAEGKTDETRILVFILMNNQLAVPRARLGGGQSCPHCWVTVCPVLHCCSLLLCPKAVPSFHKFLLQSFKDENMLLQHILRFYDSVSTSHRLFRAFHFRLHSVAEGRLPSHFKTTMFSSNCTGKNQEVSLGN